MAQALWVLNLVWQAVAAGFAFSYAVTLGAFFQWQVRAGDDEFFTRVYTPFRTALGLKWRYRLFMPFGPALTAAASLALNHSAHAVLPQALAVVVFFLYYFLAHVPTGFAQAEEALVSGKGLTPTADLLAVQHPPAHPHGLPVRGDRRGARPHLSAAPAIARCGSTPAAPSLIDSRLTGPRSARTLE